MDPDPKPEQFMFPISPQSVGSLQRMGLRSELPLALVLQPEKNNGGPKLKHMNPNIPYLMAV